MSYIREFVGNISADNISTGNVACGNVVTSGNIISTGLQLTGTPVGSPGGSIQAGLEVTIAGNVYVIPLYNP